MIVETTNPVKRSVQRNAGELHTVVCRDSSDWIYAILQTFHAVMTEARSH